MVPYTAGVALGAPIGMFLPTCASPLKRIRMFASWLSGSSHPPQQVCNAMNRRWLYMALAASLACSRTPPPDTGDLGPRGDGKTITVSDLANVTQLNLLDFIAAERPGWLRTPSGAVSSVVVYLDGVRVGGASALRNVTIANVARARYYDVAAAQQRFSLRDYSPVIEIITR